MRMLFEIFGQTLQHSLVPQAALVSNHVRHCLGCWFVATAGGLGEGFRSGNRKQFDELGENVMFIWGGRAPALNGSFTSMRPYYLTFKDYQDIVAFVRM